MEICIEACSLRLCRIHRHKIRNDGIVADLFLFGIARSIFAERIYICGARITVPFSRVHTRARVCSIMEDTAVLRIRK